MTASIESHATSLDRARRLEVGRRRAGAAHPDTCPKLHLRGVAFAVPARDEARVAFRFGPGGAELVHDDAPQPPDVAAVADLAPIRSRVCRRCGGVTAAALAIDLARHERFLTAAATLAARGLRQQYDLSDDELAWLLSFDPADGPAWLAEITEWAHVGRTDSLAERTANNTRKPWWAFWR